MYRPSTDKIKGYWFDYLTSVNSKKKVEPIKSKLIKKGYYVRTEPKKALRTGKLFYSIYVRKKKV